MTDTADSAQTYNDYLDAIALVSRSWERVAAGTASEHLGAGQELPPITEQQQRDGLALQEAHADYERKRDAYYRAVRGPAEG